MITEDYVSFEIAKLLKEKGFNEDSWFHYDTDGDIVTRGYRLNHPDDIPTWTLQMVMKWLREVKEVFIAIGFCDYPSLHKSEWIPEISTHDSVFPDSVIAYDTYEKACEEAIKYCLENLI
jgi:hypothetical protein